MSAITYFLRWRIQTRALRRARCACVTNVHWHSSIYRFYRCNRTARRRYVNTRRLEMNTEYCLIDFEIPQKRYIQSNGYLISRNGSVFSSFVFRFICSSSSFSFLLLCFIGFIRFSAERLRLKRARRANSTKVYQFVVNVCVSVCDG